MIKIDFVTPSTTTWKQWCKKCRAATDKLAASIQNGEAWNVSDIYKHSDIKKGVFFAKDGPFGGRCAYCECYITDFQHGDIEHFRPKRGVTDAKDGTVYCTDASGNQKEHPGYYWLAYDWQNLLPSCVTCNQPTTSDSRKIGKRNRFPVEGAHAMSSQEIPNEKPLLINPTIDDPKHHLKVNIKNGLMCHRSKRGKMCIDVFGLNIRDQLVHERKRAILEASALWDKLGKGSNAEQTEVVEELKKIKKGKYAYAAAGRAALEHFAQSALLVINS